MRPNLITRLKEEWNNLDPVDPLRGLIADAIDALAEQPAQEPVAYSYTSRITGAQGVSHHPMPRFIDSESWDIKPLYTSPQPAQQQELVATDWERIARVQDAKLRAMCNEPGGFEKLCEVMNRYERTSPPASKPLTDEEIIQIASTPDGSQATTKGYVIPFARAIEAKLKEKNT